MIRFRPRRISRFLLLLGLGILVIPHAKFAAPSQAQSPQIQAGLSAQGFISTDSSAQNWEFTPTEDQTLTVLVNRLSGDLDPMVTVLDSEGDVVAENDDRIANFVLDAGIEDVEFNEGETYTIRVGGHRGAGDYRLWLVPSFSWVEESVGFEGDASRWDGRFARQDADGLVIHTEEQGVRSIGPAFKFGVELADQHEGMVAQLGDFHETAVGRQPAKHHARLFQQRPIGVVELPTVPVALMDQLFAICRRR